MPFAGQNSFRSNVLSFRNILLPTLSLSFFFLRDWFTSLTCEETPLGSYEAPRPFSCSFFFLRGCQAPRSMQVCRYMYAHCFWSRRQWATNVINLKGLIWRIVCPRSFQLILINTIINKEYNVLSIRRDRLNSEYSTTCIRYIRST